MFLAHQVLESLRPVFPRKNLITHTRNLIGWISRENRISENQKAGARRRLAGNFDPGVQVQFPIPSNPVNPLQIMNRKTLASLAADPKP